MRWLTALLLLSIGFQQTCASGLMEIHLKSAFDQKATVILSNGINPTYIALPIILQKDVETKFGGLLVDFSNTYNLAILVDETAALGLNSTIYQAKITPTRGTVSPSKLNLPLSGIRFDFKCDPNYYGEQCNILCDEITTGTGECSSAETEKTWEKDIELSAAYTVNPFKMEMLVEMLKKENEVENSFAKPVIQKETEKIEVEQTEQVPEGSGLLPSGVLWSPSGGFSSPSGVLWSPSGVHSLPNIEESNDENSEVFEKFPEELTFTVKTLDN